MKHRIRWLYYNRKDILYVDFSGLNLEGTLKLMDLVLEEQINYEKKVILMICNINNIETSDEQRKKAKFNQRILDKKKIIVYISMIGITGFSKYIIKTLTKRMYIAKDLEDAQQWLVKH